MNHVLDASALLAFLHREPGDLRVSSLLHTAGICAVNWAEVVQKSLAKNVNVRGMREDLIQMGLKIVPFTPLQAELAGRLWNDCRQFGLSLGDRSCLALAMDSSLPVVTMDRVWQRLKLDLQIEVLR